MERLPTLPLSLFASVVAYAVPGYAEDLVPKARLIPVEPLQALALVGRAWLQAVNELVAQLRLSLLTLNFETASRAELLAMRRKVNDRGQRVLDLRVCMGRMAPFGEYFQQNRDLPRDVHDLDLGWDVLFAHLPALRRLDLSAMPLSSPHIRLIVGAAAKNCENIESLVLPGKEHNHMHAGAFKVDELLETVYNALAKWRGAGKRSGLRQLTVPALNDVQRFESCTKFFKNVVAYCPRVEYLDGYKQSLNELDKLTCQQSWPLCLQDWETFNATCTNLCEFHWVVAPFADPFFRVFGEHVKPRLTKLTFAVNMLWEWPRYFLDCDTAAGVTQNRWNEMDDEMRPGYGIRASDASAALQGCPALDDLEIALYHPEDVDDIDPYGNDHTDLPEEEMLNPDIFGDDFCETVTKYCPMVSRFAIWEVTEGHTDELTPIRTFTDRGLVTLSRLKYLAFMELRTVNITGQGLFDFLNGLSDEFLGQRTFQIGVGGNTIPLAFYEEVMSLLMQIAETSKEDLALARRKFVLRLQNASFGSVDEGWSVGYLNGLKLQVERVKKAHPTLRLRLTTTGYTGDRLRSIIELGLYTADAEPSVWYGWAEEESNPDVTFVNRDGHTHVAPGDDYGDLPLELMDPDSLPLDYELPASYLGDYYPDEYDYDFYDGNADELW